jgi:hypothetical protein
MSTGFDARKRRHKAAPYSTMFTWLMKSACNELAFIGQAKNGLTIGRIAQSTEDQVHSSSRNRLKLPIQSRWYLFYRLFGSLSGNEAFTIGVFKQSCKIMRLCLLHHVLAVCLHCAEADL